MSPTEDDLRTALRHGEGEDGLDADRIMARGYARRVQRRNRLLGGAAAALFVGALGTGVGLIAHNDTNGSSTSAKYASPADRAANAPVQGATASSSGMAPSAPSGVASGAGCPAMPTHQLLPGGGSPGQFGSGGKLFPKPVTTLVVCGYTTGPTIKSAAPTRVTLTGSSAATIVDSLENASKTRLAGVCPDYEPAVQRTLVFIGVVADGSTNRQVTVTSSGPTCRTMVTNGTAVRYAWTPPKGYSVALLPATPDRGVRPPGGGNQKNGSPIR